jgi:hypothetical protein
MGHTFSRPPVQEQYRVCRLFIMWTILTHVDALVGLLGAVVGGLLVLIGEYLRRRQDDRREAIRQLQEAAAALAVQYGRLVGEIRDARLSERDTTHMRHIRPNRYEATIKFFMTPGSDALRPSATAMIRAYQMLVSLDAPAEDVESGFAEYFAAARKFEAEVRDIGMVRAAINRGRLRSLPPVGDA